MVGYNSVFSSDSLEELVEETEQNIRKYIYSKLNPKLINSLDITVILEADNGFNVDIEIILDTESFTEDHQKIVDAAMEVGFKFLENKLEGKSVV
ncbi:MAG: DUF3194 domain-containing protein [Candidatus Odinarchaeia archaeon]